MVTTEPRPLEYPEHFRPGMGTENVAPFLRSLAQLVRPHRILEVGAGYTTPFLLEALVNNTRVLNDGNLKEEYLSDYSYESKLIVIDDMSLGDLQVLPGMVDILSSPYVEFVEGKFEGKSEYLKKNYGLFDFVWFDCGGVEEYKKFFAEYWDICSFYIICHFTYSNDKPNENLRAILNGIKGAPFMIDIIEPHKTRQGSLTIIKKKSP